MPRSGEEARRRLQQAALELYRKRGFDETTTAEIAARAKVTERTFFRHFADKREVLFDGEEAVRAAITHAVAEVPAGVAPLPTLLRAYRQVMPPLLEQSRDVAGSRARIIDANPALQERSLAKMAATTEALAAALRARGVTSAAAMLAAQVAMAAFTQAVRAWMEDPSARLDTLVVQAFDDLRALAGTIRNLRGARR